MGKPDQNPKIACITLDLEDFGKQDNLSASTLIHDDQLFERLGTVLRTNGVKLTVFVVGKLLEEVPQVIEKFSQLNAEFELHSYSHEPGEPDSQMEIDKALVAYESHFSKRPLGYRAPWGKISPEGLERLACTGFRYDSSIFPSFRPGVYNNLRAPITPFRLPNSSLIEIPISVVPKLRLVLAMSYLKFFGLGSYQVLFKMFGMPDPLVFDMHLNDFKTDSETLQKTKLPGWVRYYHARNVEKAFDMFEAFLRMINERGYTLSYMSELYESLISNVD